ncbi:dihydrolipoamide acetyltransferase family protein [Herbiconiux flava]|uniref:Dihydrolipoamide acetyltransferase component of pyruvate dehydrogenase complex n=1 Tax=Herbiconiux flava TaxID=881268 RepID=A0A852S7N2_9MICO|nr:dihydrolipoamide acetyltransferase family protein [Herbiconiux flava]NYD69268.1 pyruvate dehydrogenase E2 component (dihydrolipoamide acetyltransferase) [Herbiconiux flava]GLK16014.1 acetyltransferase component of pyruvate dehydrogenase complex [Herbiconiux flava]
MATIIRMPSVLAGSEEAAIASWLVTPGQTVAVGDPLAEIETEKAVVEYNSEDAGVVGRVLLEPGQAGEIGAPIAVLISEGETDADIDAALGQAPAAAVTGPDSAPDATERDPDGGTPVVEAASLEAAAEEAAPAAPAAPAAASAASEEAPQSDSARLFVSPIARKLAKERGLDPAAITGTGPGGRIVRRDVEEAVVPSVAAPAAAAAPAAERASVDPETTSPDGTELVPHTAMRKAIARRLTESKSTVPHFYLTAECRVDELLALRARVNETSSVRVSVNDFVLKAVAAAFQAVPEANVTWSDEGMRVHPSVDIAVAVATDGGLVTPVVRGVDARSLSSVSTAVADLAGRAKAKKLKQSELEGGSFSVSNLGMYGTLEFAAILNPPHSGILAVGAAKPQPVVVDGELAVATVMRCTLSVDHRAVDGALAARWLAAFQQAVENPLSILV